jgi:hypothetical protein
MQRQTFQGPVHWVIVDDGHTPQPIEFDRPNWTLTVLRPTPFWSRGQNTQARNLLAGLDLVGPTDTVAIIEDDDWYGENWLRTIDSMRDTAELIGEKRAFYYNVAQSAYLPINNARHASLCATAVSGGAIQTLRRVCHSHRKFIDLELWRQHPRKQLFEGSQVIGIKGLPGREGIGIGHQAKNGFHPDVAGEVLRHKIGVDADFYLNFFSYEE